jgi:ribonuclease Z
MDHIGGLGMYIASRNLLSLPPPTILVPESKIEAISNFIDALRVLDDSDLPHEMIPFAPSAETCYSMKNKNYKIKAFETVHPIASQGYVILSTKQKLKDEYLSLKGSEIKALKDDGVEITDTVDVPEIMFTGDTTMDFLHSSPQEVIQEGLKSRLVCLECTFVNDDVSPADAKRFGHTHVRDIAENADRFRECENILLIHFSARYTREEIREGLRNQLAESHAWLYAKITPMLAGYD